MDDPIDLINEYIVTNHNNEITAAVLNPVLQAIVLEYRDFIGDLNLLTTPVTEDVVGAVNSLQQQINDFDYSGVQVYSGEDDPNTTPPLTFSVADFYNQVDGGGDTIALWQYNGTEWVNLIAITTPNLQNVTDVGATTTNDIVVTNGTASITYSKTRIVYNNGTNQTTLQFVSPTDNRDVSFPDKSGTLAMLSDLGSAPAITNGTFKIAMKGSQSGVANTDLNVIEINDWCLKLGLDGEGGFWQYNGGGDTNPANYTAIITATGNS